MRSLAVFILPERITFLGREGRVEQCCSVERFGYLSCSNNIPWIVDSELADHVFRT